jgi:hypothetical protein
MGYYAFFYCFNLTDVTIGNRVTNIADNAFTGCKSLRSVTIPNSVTNIGWQAFWQCTSLTDVTIGDSVTNIEEFAFSTCTNLASLAIGTNVTTIRPQAFESCFSLTNVTLPDSVTSIWIAAFNACTSLTNVTVGTGLTNIASDAFIGCGSLMSFTVAALNPIYCSVDGVLFDKSRTTLVEYPQGRVGSYTIPTRVTSIGYGAFANCTSLMDVTIPNTVTNVGGRAFSLCTNLAAVYFEGNAPSLGGGYLFYEDSNATAYYLPGTTGWGPTFGGVPTALPTALWFLPNPVILNNGPGFGVQTNQFGFIISWATIVPVTVEACTNLSHPFWYAVQTVNLTNGSAYFADPEATNYPHRFYRVRWP